MTDITNFRQTLVRSTVYCMRQTVDAKDTSTMTTVLLQQKYECHKQVFIGFSLQTTTKSLRTLIGRGKWKISTRKP